MKILVQAIIIVIFLFLNMSSGEPIPEFIVLFLSYIFSSVLVEFLFHKKEKNNRKN